MFYRAFNENTVNDLVEAFIFFQTIQPGDIKFANGKDVLNRAKFLYLIEITNKDGAINHKKRQFAWASALLFSKILEWEEFKVIKKLVDDYIDKIYKDYELLRTHTTRELLEIDKELAVLKYALSM